jgi:hypothetical protein
MKIAIGTLLFTKWDMKINSCHRPKIHKGISLGTNVKSGKRLLRTSFFHNLIP